MVDRVEFTDTVWCVLPSRGLYLSVARKSDLNIITCGNWIFHLAVVCDLVTWVRLIDCTVPDYLGTDK